MRAAELQCKVRAQEAGALFGQQRFPGVPLVGPALRQSLCTGEAGVSDGRAASGRGAPLRGLAARLMLQHSVQGWCPPMPIFRRLGARTAADIGKECAALQALASRLAATASKDAAPGERARSVFMRRRTDRPVGKALGRAGCLTLIGQEDLGIAYFGNSRWRMHAP